MPGKQRKSHGKRTINLRKQSGGNGGATGWAPQVYGDIGQQQAVPGTNVIATHTPSSMPSPQQVVGVVPMKGGKAGGSLTNLAVPAVFLVANQMFTKRRRSSSSKHRRSAYRGKRSRRRRPRNT